MTASALRAFRKGGLHFRRSIRRKQLDIPGIFDLPAQYIKGEIRVADAFPDTDRLFDRGLVDIDAIFLGIGYQLADKGRYGHNRRRLETLNGFPLQGRYARAETDHTGAHFAGS